MKDSAPVKKGWGDRSLGWSDSRVHLRPRPGLRQDVASLDIWWSPAFFMGALIESRSRLQATKALSGADAKLGAPATGY